LKKLTFFNLEIIYEKTVIKHIWDLWNIILWNTKYCKQINTWVKLPIA
jgi:hypothetical protein